MEQLSNSAIISGFIVAVIIIITLLIILYRLYRFLFRNKLLFGETLQTRIISLGISGIFFSKGLVMIFINPAQILIRSLISFYTSIQDMVNNSAAKGSSGTGYAFTDIVPRLFITAIRDLDAWFQSFNVGLIFLTLAAWSLIGQLIDSFYRSGSVSENNQDYKVLRQNIVLGLIFALSIYLSLAAIITVPYFAEEQKEQPKEESLKAQLDNIKEGTDKKLLLTLTTTEPVFDPDTAIQKSIDTIKSGELKVRAFSIYNNWNESFRRNIISRRSSLNSLNNTQITLSKKFNEEENRIINDYATQSTNLKAKLKLSYISSLVEYFSDFTDFYINNANNLKATIENHDEKLKYDIQNFQQAFNDFMNYNQKPDSIGYLNQMNNYYLTNLPYYYSGQDYYNPDNYYYSLPLVPVAGEELGIFKGIAQWLIKPFSMELVLIVGMLGFGLFGAVISTFVKETRDVEEYRKDNIIIKDIPGVIIRGISAAIVIFLAVKGGLAIFSAGKGEPNPYALFFTCLVGAVYSEKIWEWAKGKLTSSFEDAGKQAKASTPVSGEEAPPANTAEETP